MPLATDPEQVFEIVLESDKDKPVDIQPRFMYRYLSMREFRQVGNINDSIVAEDTADDAVDKTLKALSVGLIGWENLKDRAGKIIPFDPGKISRIEDAIGAIEAQELIAKILRQHPSISDKKKLDLPSESDTATPVTDVRE